MKKFFFVLFLGAFLEMSGSQRLSELDKGIIKDLVIAMQRNDFRRQCFIIRSEIIDRRHNQFMSPVQAYASVFRLRDIARAKYLSLKCLQGKPKKPFMT